MKPLPPKTDPELFDAAEILMRAIPDANIEFTRFGVTFAKRMKSDRPRTIMIETMGAP